MRIRNSAKSRAFTELCCLSRCTTGRALLEQIAKIDGADCYHDAKVYRIPGDYIIVTVYRQLRRFERLSQRYIAPPR